jgi:hypothetical protein
MKENHPRNDIGFPAWMISTAKKGKKNQGWEKNFALPHSTFQFYFSFFVLFFFLLPKLAKG